MSRMTLRTVIEEFREHHGVAAVGGGLVEANGNVRVEVVGTRSRKDATIVAEDDCWHIGSCAKAITAALYGRQIEKGIARWETPVADLFSDIQSIDPSWAAVTMEQVLLHRGGVSANLSLRAWLAAHRSPDPPNVQRSNVALKALSSPPNQPGVFRYSNLGYTLVGAAIDRLTGTTYEESLSAEILAPLGILSAGFGAPPVIQGHRNRRPRLIARTSRPAPPGNPNSDNPSAMNPAGRLHLSLPDWAKFLALFVVGDQTLLTSETLEKLIEPVGVQEQRYAMGWASTAQIPGVSLGHQGSNTLWSATALLGSELDRAAFIVWNDGRSDLRPKGPQVASALLQT